MDFDDAGECFDVLKNIVADTPAEPYLLSILQHFLFIKDDVVIRYHFNLEVYSRTLIIFVGNGR